MVDYLLKNIERSVWTVLLTLAVIAANSYPDTRSFCRSSATLFSTIWLAWSLRSRSYQIFSIGFKFGNFEGQWKTGIYSFFSGWFFWQTYCWLRALIPASSSWCLSGLLLLMSASFLSFFFFFFQCDKRWSLLYDYYCIHFLKNYICF